MRFPVSFLIYPLAFAQILSSYPQGPRVGYWCLSLSFCSTFVVERFYRHIKSKGRGTPGAGRALPEDFRTLCVYVCVCVRARTVIPCRSGVEESEQRKEGEEVHFLSKANYSVTGEFWPPCSFCFLTIFLIQSFHGLINAELIHGWEPRNSSL